MKIWRLRGLVDIMNKQERDNEIEDLLRAIVSGVVIIMLLLIIGIMLHLTSASRNKKILYDGDFFEIYQKGDSVYIWNKDIDGGLIELDPEDPLIQRLWEKVPEGNSQTHMGEQ